MKNKKDNSLMWIVIAVAVFVLFGTFGFRGYGMMSMMYGNYGYGMMFFGWIFSILILVALILFIMWLIKQIQKK